MLSAAAPPSPVMPSLEDVPTPAGNFSIQTVIIPLPLFSTLNGPIRYLPMACIMHALVGVMVTVLSFFLCKM